MKKNIGLLLPSINSGGAERAATRLSNILCEQYNIYVILFENTYMKYPYNGELINMDIKAEAASGLKRLALPFRRARKLKKIKKQYKLDAVISFMDSPNIVNLFSKTGSCRTIVSIRNFDYKENSKFFDVIEKIVLKKADAVIPVSKVIGEVIGKRYRIPDEKIHVIYNPYDIDQISVQKDEDLEEHNDFFTNKKCFISVGRHMHQKGFWHLVKAFSILAKKYDDVSLVIVGRDEMNGKVQELAYDLSISDKVLIVGFSDNPFKYINKSSAYVLSSLYEGFPNSLVEAMACGCPVIAVDCKSGPREILYIDPDINKVCEDIEYADYGMMVKPLEKSENWDSTIITTSEKSLAKAMEKMLDDDLREEYAIKAFERSKVFNYELCKQKYIEVIEGLYANQD